jgi:competence protein ComEA
MNLYTPRQFTVILVLAVTLFLFFVLNSVFGKKAQGLFVIERPKYVYELRGDVDKEGFYCFAQEQDIKGLLRACGGDGREYESDQDHSIKVKSGRRVFIGDGVRIEVMDAPARLNYYQLLSVNSVSAEDLTLIPGIGMRTAEAIVSYRVKNKGIKDLPELRAVKGIGEKKLQVLIPYLGLSD